MLSSPNDPDVPISIGPVGEKQKRFVVLDTEMSPYANILEKGQEDDEVESLEGKESWIFIKIYFHFLHHYI